MNVGISHPTDKANFSIVELGEIEIAFSYQTPIGFNLYDGKGWVIRYNAWGPTTGKHMNWLDDRGPDYRIPGDSFESRLASLGEWWTVTT